MFVLQIRQPAEESSAPVHTNNLKEIISTYLEEHKFPPSNTTSCGLSVKYLCKRSFACFDMVPLILPKSFSQKRESLNQEPARES